MQLMIIGGTLISLVGLAGLIWCIAKVWRARKSGLPDDDLRAVVKGVLPWNMAALFSSILGLMLIVVAIFLG